MKLSLKTTPKASLLAAPAFLLCAAALVPAAQAAPAAVPAYHLIKKVSLPGPGGWDYLLADADSHRLYITHNTQVLVLDTNTYQLVGDILGTDGVHGVALAPALGKGYASDGRSNTVTVFDLQTLKPTGTIAVGQRPDAILYEPKTQRVWTFNGGSNDATAIDAKTGKVVGTVPLGGRPEFAAADGRGMIYDNIEDKNEIVAINAKTLAVTARYPIAPLESPSGLAIDAKNRRLFAVCDGAKMAVVNADTGKVVATPAIGDGPDAAGFDPGTGLAFSSNGQTATLTVIARQSEGYAPAQTVPTQAGARTMALDTKTHRVFLVTATAAPAAPGDSPRRRTYVPGSFTLLVYGP